MRTRQPYLADQLIGFVIPLGIFLEAGSPIFLATSPLAQEGFAFPISILMIPLALFLSIARQTKRCSFPRSVTYLSAAMTTYCIIMSIYASLTIRSDAILYGLQWILPFAWMPYFTTIGSEQRLTAFMQAFVYGSFFNIIYYFSAGAAEFALYGSLLDGGRLSQNLVLPGQYQIAVYVPTMIAFSIIISNILLTLRLVQMNTALILIFNVFGFLSIIFLAAREAILVILSFLIVALFISGGARRVLSIAAVGGFLFVALNPSFIASIFADSEFRLLTKLASLDESDAYLGGRDTMVLDVIKVIKQDPLFGSHFLPPDSGLFVSTVNAPSAHNMYVDAVAWSGIMGGALYISLCLVLLLTALKSFSKYNRERYPFYCYISACLLVMLLISNNLNVPMRQPLIAPLFAMLAFLSSRLTIPERGAHGKG